jgi:hypothetical protein
MFKFAIVLRGPVLSGTDRPRSEAVSRFLTAQDYQRRLATIDTQLRLCPEFGHGVERTINDVGYRSLFDENWMIELHVQMVLGQRVKNQHADLDNLLRDFQNALAFPATDLRVEPPSPAQPLYTVVVDDNQFTKIEVTRVPDPSVCREDDLVIANFTVLKAPALHLMLAR